MGWGWLGETVKYFRSMFLTSNTIGQSLTKKESCTGICDHPPPTMAAILDFSILRQILYICTSSGVQINSTILKACILTPRSWFSNQSCWELQMWPRTMAAILDFSILKVILWFLSLEPLLIGISTPKNPYVRIFMLSSESEHLFDISARLLYEYFSDFKVRCS